jgi:hypothetical protein
VQIASMAATAQAAPQALLQLAMSATTEGQMNEESGEDTKPHISRRRVLEAGACALGAAFLGASAVSAQESPNLTPSTPKPPKVDSVIPKKATQEKAHYQVPGYWRTCSTCRHYEKPDACRVVEGKIDPSGRCILYIRVSKT